MSGLSDNKKESAPDGCLTAKGLLGDASAGQLSCFFEENKTVISRIARWISLPDWLVLVALTVFSVVLFLGPLVRSFYHIEIDYNEGWNAYNIQKALHHLPLYSPEYRWTPVNYPIASFYVLAYLTRLTGDPVLTGRMVSLVSLLACCLLVGVIIRKVTGHLGPAIFGISFCLGIFCAAAPGYVGMNDPQMLAQPFFLLGLLAYLGRSTSGTRIGSTAFLFVAGGNIKHNLLAAPTSVFTDLLTVSRRKAVQFLAWGAIFLAMSIAVSMTVGGPLFISRILATRRYSILRTAYFFRIYGCLQLPFLVSIGWSIWQMSNERYRALSLYFFASFFWGVFFSGGHKIDVNVFFDNFLAMSIITAICLDSVWQAPIPLMRKKNPWRTIVPLLFYSSMIFAFAQSTFFNLPSYLKRLPREEKQFEEDVSFLADQPGPAICESLLRCYYAGKPFVFDPSNSTSLVRLGRLNPEEIVRQVAERKYGAIELDAPVTEMDRPSDRFPGEILDAIDRYYQLSRQSSNSAIYLPRGHTDKTIAVR